jgi:hypothetical protein
VTFFDFAPGDMDDDTTADLCSWESIAEAVRRHARTESPEEAADLEWFAEFLDGLAELARRSDG